MSHSTPPAGPSTSFVAKSAPGFALDGSISALYGRGSISWNQVFAYERVLAP